MLLASGEVSLQASHGGVFAEVARVRQGEFFGEAGLHGAQRDAVSRPSSPPARW